VEELQRCNEPLAIAVLVVHNKDKPKKGVLPKGVTCVSITLYS
jgi:hypothetical protein